MILLVNLQSDNISISFAVHMFNTGCYNNFVAPPAYIVFSLFSVNIHGLLSLTVSFHMKTDNQRSFVMKTVFLTPHLYSFIEVFIYVIYAHMNNCKHFHFDKTFSNYFLNIHRVSLKVTILYAIHADHLLCKYLWPVFI